jgi:putative membrane protein
MDKEKPKLSDKLAQKRTHLSAQRTVMSADRSLMSWVRTGLTMIGFGFTIYAFLQSLLEKGVMITMTPAGPRRIGLFLLALGTASVLLGSFQYLVTLRSIKRIYDFSPWRFSLLIAALIALLGILLLVAVLVKVHLV